MAVLGLDVSPFKRATMQAGADARAAGRDIQQGFGQFVNSKLPFLAGAGAFMAIEEVARKSVEWGAKVVELSERLGISTEAVQRWDYALKQNGSTIEAAANFFDKLGVAREKIRRGEEGSDKLVENMRRLGVTMADVMGPKRTEDLAAQIAKAYQLGDPQTLIRDMRGLGIRASGELVTAFRGGLSDLIDPSKTHIVIVSDHDLQNLKDTWQATKDVGDLLLKIGGWLTSHVGIGIEKALIVPVLALKNFLKNGNLEQAWADAEAHFEDVIKKHYEKQAQKLSDARKAGGESSTDDEDGKGGDKKTKTDREINRLKEQTHEIIQRNALAEMNGAERVIEMTKRLKSLRDQMAYAYATGDPLFAAKTAKDIAEAEAEMHRAEKAKDSEEKAALKKEQREGFHSAQVSERQRIGAYVSPAEMAAQGLMQRSEGHLARMEKHLAKIEDLTQRTKF
jgi:hypothetical protein